MNQKLFTILEIIVLAGLILAVMYFGGVFDSTPPIPTTAPAITTQAVTLTPTASTPKSTRTPRPTRAPLFTLTTPPLTQPWGLIAFETTRDGNSEIYVMVADHVDGSNQINLTRNPADDMWPSWSPDGKRIAFFSTRNGWLEIYAMDVDGANLTQVSHTLSKNIVYDPPVYWSPDGKQMLAVRRTVWSSYHMPDSLALELIQVDGSGATTLFKVTGLALRPSWSPDGKYIYVYLLAQGEERQTYSLFIGTLTDTRFDFNLASRDLISDTYVWSPDSSRLAFEDDDHDIVIIKPDGSDKRQLVSTSHISNFLQIISWSPDGQYLLYVTDGFAFHAVRADGSGVIDLDSRVKADDYESAIAVSWSSDSQWLAYEKQGEIFIVNIYDSVSPIQLTRSGNNYSPRWQP